MNRSIWSGKTDFPKFDKAQGEIKTDVLIIGGGLCGVLCAYFLEQAGADYLLVEGRRIGSGATKNTTAKITAQHGLIYSRLIKSAGREKAGLYLKANLKALKEYERLCGDIDCDFEKKDSYVYSLDSRRKIEEEVEAVNSLGFKAQFKQNTGLPFSSAGAVMFPGQAQFNPLKFLFEISKDLNIRENTFVKKVEDGFAITDTARIKAEKIITATHFPFINRYGGYFLKLYQSRSYAAAFENAADVGGMYVDEKSGGISLRNYGRLLIVGGGGGRTGQRCESWDALERFAKKCWPHSRLTARWAAQDCMSLDKVPYIGQYHSGKRDLLVASGFNKWGMTSSMAAASILTDMALGRKNLYAEVFSPQRSALKPQLFVNSTKAVMNLLTPSVKRCPHMGCALKYNKAEHSWDCPCHGSRFTEDGAVIDNPAMKDAEGLQK